MNVPSSIVESSEIDVIISLWLNAKTRRTGSSLTYSTYERIIKGFRRLLWSKGLELDPDKNIRCEINEESRKHARKIISIAAQGFAQQSDSEKPVSSSTYNQRLSVLSSFYKYANDNDHFSSGNPIVKIERSKVQAYANAQPMDTSEVAASMKKMDRSTKEGARDYAMLGIFLQTGRRLAEVVKLCWQDVEIRGDLITLTFHCKGGKIMRDTLPAPLSKALLHWLALVYGCIEDLKPDIPLWISLTRKSGKMEGLTVRSVSDICKRRLGVSQVHKMRHTWARRMEEEGAKVSDIQARLGHESLATTGRYLSALKQSENKHADAISKAFGLDD